MTIQYIKIFFTISALLFYLQNMHGNEKVFQLKTKVIRCKVRPGHKTAIRSSNKSSTDLMKKEINKLNTNPLSISISATTPPCKKSTVFFKEIKIKKIKRFTVSLKKHNIPVCLESNSNNKLMLNESNKRIAFDAQDKTICFAIHDGLLNINNVKMTVKNGKLSWNGNTEPPADSGIELVETSQLTLQKNQKAMIKMVSDLQYFKKNSNGFFELKKIKKNNAPGMIMGAKITPITRSEHLKLNFELKINVMKERNKINGVNLNVGKPVIISDQIIKTIKTKLDTWYFICGYSITNKQNKQKDDIYILAKVSRQKSKGKPMK